MSQDDVERFIGRLISDDIFREIARKSVQEVCVKYGLCLTPEEQTLISKDDFLRQCDTLSQFLHGGLQRHSKF